MGRRHIRPACLKGEPNTLGQFVLFESNRVRAAPSRLHQVGTVATVRLVLETAVSIHLESLSPIHFDLEIIYCKLSVIRCSIGN